MSNTFFNNIRGKFVFGHCQDLAKDLAHNQGPVLGFTALQNMLNDIVSVLVLNEVHREAVELIEERVGNMIRTVLKNTLNDTAAVRVSCEGKDLALEGTDNESDSLDWDPLNGLLNDMVSVLVFDTFQNVSFKFHDDRCLLVHQNMLECL